MTHRQHGVTLAELLIAAALLVTLAAVVLPTWSINDSSKLSVAAATVGNALRFARSEAMRTNGNVLVDAETVPGHLLLKSSGCASTGAAPLLDPQTKRAFDVTVSDGPYSGGVAMTARFLAGGAARGGLVFDASGAATLACSVAAQTAHGAPEAGSGIDLTYSGQTRTVAIDPATGRVTGL